MEPRYLGDAVYVQEWNDFGDGIKLTTDSHHEHEAGNIIFIEPAVLRALLKWVDEFKKEKGVV